jgi:isoquinoline 1-oxidoreductase alpha subunit
MTAIRVNGQERQVSAADGTPLLYVLRNELNLMTPKFGCGLAQCGACSVLLGDEEIRSCITPVSAPQGKEVTTVEGLPARWIKRGGAATKGALHPLQEAWVEEQVPQCGICQFGMMIKVTELLESNPAPSDADIKAALTTSGPSPHLSRRGFLAAGGALIVAVNAKPGMASTATPNTLDATAPGSWIEISADNTVLIRTGKCDFGQSSIYAAYRQIVAEELGMPLSAMTTVVSGDTDRTPDGGGTFGLLRTNVLNLRKVAAYSQRAGTGARHLPDRREAIAACRGLARPFDADAHSVSVDCPRFKKILSKLRDASGWITRPSPAPKANAKGDGVVRGQGVSIMRKSLSMQAASHHATGRPIPF